MSIPNTDLDPPDDGRFCYACRMWHAPNDPDYPACYDPSYAEEQAMDAAEREADRRRER